MVPAPTLNTGLRVVPNDNGSFEIHVPDAGIVDFDWSLSLGATGNWAPTMSLLTSGAATLVDDEAYAGDVT